MNIFGKIALIFLLPVLVVSFAVAQKNENQSRLNVGKTPKKSSFSTLPNQNILLKANSSKITPSNSKSVINQYYRSVLLSNNNATTKNVVQTSQVDVNNESLSKNEKLVVGNIYPNPADDYAYIDYKVTGSYNSASVSFYNLLGGKVAEYELNKNSDKVKINTSSWESGIYGYQLVIDGKKVATKKLLVSHN
jgi:hypothetical protein